MRKFTFRFMACLLAVGTVLAFNSCKDDDDEINSDSLLGTWELVRSTGYEKGYIDGKLDGEFSWDEPTDSGDDEWEEEWYFQITFYSDGRCKYSDTDYYYELSGNRIIFDGEEDEYEDENNYLNNRYYIEKLTAGELVIRNKWEYKEKINSVQYYSYGEETVTFTSLSSGSENKAAGNVTINKAGDTEAAVRSLFQSARKRHIARKNVGGN